MIQTDIYRMISDKLLQYAISVGGGLLLAFETSIPYFIPCFISVVLDIFSAYCLNLRLSKVFPGRTDGKFRSSYKFKALYTLFVLLLLLIIGHYVDLIIIKESDASVRFITAVFLFYECWSVLENWSSENPNKFAKALQRIMINKAERHLNVPLSDIMLDDNKMGGENADNE